MKQLIILFIIAIFAAATVSAVSIDNECETFGLDNGVSKWECNDNGAGWEIAEQEAGGTSVTGSCSVANWDVSPPGGAPPGADGIIVKAGSTVHYGINGTNGIVTQHKPEISHITFCGNAQEIPEFGAITAAIALIGSGMGFLFLRKRY